MQRSTFFKMGYDVPKIIAVIVKVFFKIPFDNNWLYSYNELLTLTFYIEYFQNLDKKDVPYKNSYILFCTVRPIVLKLPMLSLEYVSKTYQRHQYLTIFDKLEATKKINQLEIVFTFPFDYSFLTEKFLNKVFAILST